ncbi:N-acetylglucosaminyl-phosphatidylinositol de-N-acetylase [Coccinella septempunctata]|uniref:N-acetylglucosaminyl-phosphatidylinositol de-N-acetylase n=1 Tax=Coccinella septempunctata TaxID=41139 RepID=UPI001D075DDD|nr:N-acetylglucosaminyl-phosphatidylinositol de-N-acetylase [Coccinella septempunctata]
MCEVSQAFAWHDPFFFLTYVNESVSNFQVELVNYTKDILEHLIIGSFLYIVTCILLYFAIIRWKTLSFNKSIKNPKRVLIVTAHPDDECMFFGPTILNLTKNKECTVYILCLSTGSNYGMGKIRKYELYKSCRTLGIASDSITVMNHEDLPDDISKRWPEEIVAELILNHIEIYDITTLITFDRSGISSHPNHFSIYYAVAHLSFGGDIPKSCSVYVLESINVLRKYWFILDIPISFLLSRTRYIVGPSGRSVIHKAMSEHKSQMVWFRRLYLIFSRYVVINTLQEMNPSDIELDLSIDD